MISANDMNKNLQNLSVKFYKISNKIDLKRFSTHFLWIGKCLKLHVAGSYSPMIQKSLWWKLDAFLMTLRNVSSIVQDQNIVLVYHDPDGDNLGHRSVITGIR